ncbi:MAG TPA: winged helix-turn-helix domain-containing protein [Solirubrobacterales bacterium]|nr:winged helix-turn-helix domain-containing protein [Solirubrobacterales bacterium]
MLARGEMVNEVSEKKGKRPGRAVLDQRLAKALAHPTRVHILSILNEGPSSPSKIAKRLDGVSLNLTSHHIKVLRELGCVELVREVTHGGRTEHIYRATKRQHFTPDEWEEVEPHARPPITVSILRLISEDVDKSLASGKFDELPDNHLSRSPLDVDQEGWQEIVSILNRALDEVLEANVRSAERARLSGEELRKIRVVMMQFLMDPERT